MKIMTTVTCPGSVTSHPLVPRLNSPHHGSLPADVVAGDHLVSDVIAAASRFRQRAHGLCRQDSAGLGNTDVRKQMMQVVGDLEMVLGELKTVVGDIKTLVGQIDVVTSKIDGACVPEVTDAKVRRSSASVLEAKSLTYSGETVPSVRSGRPGSVVRHSASHSCDLLRVTWDKHTAGDGRSPRNLRSPTSLSDGARTRYQGDKDKNILASRPSSPGSGSHVSHASRGDARSSSSGPMGRACAGGVWQEKRRAESDRSSTSKSLSDFLEEENYILAQFTRPPSRGSGSTVQPSCRLRPEGGGGRPTTSREKARSPRESKSTSQHNKKAKRECGADNGRSSGSIHSSLLAPHDTQSGVSYTSKMETMSRFLEDAARSVASDDTWGSPAHAPSHVADFRSCAHLPLDPGKKSGQDADYSGVYEREMEERLELEFDDAFDLLETLDGSVDCPDDVTARMALCLDCDATYDKDRAIQSWTQQARRKAFARDVTHSFSVSEDRTDSMTESSGDFLEDPPGSGVSGPVRAAGSGMAGVRMARAGRRGVACYSWRTVIEP